MMASIIVYTNPDVLLHKQGKLPGDEDYSLQGFYCWSFGNGVPQTLQDKWRDDDRIYFATKGFIRGYFKISDIDPWDIEFNTKSWKDIKPVPCKPFQGFKYADKVTELWEEN